MTSRLQRHARIANLRSRRQSVGDEEVQTVLAHLDDCDLIEDVEALVMKWTGRKRNISVRGLLVGMFLASNRNRGSVILTHVADLLAFSLSDTMREELEVHRYPDNDRGFEAIYAVVRRLFKAIVKEVDPSPLPKGRRLDLDVVAELLASADHSELADRRELMLTIANKILGTSLLDAQPLLEETPNGSAVVDATVFGTYSKGLGRESTVTATDPEAGWYVRTTKHKDPLALDGLAPTPSRQQKKGAKQPKEKDRVKKKLYGYDATLIVFRNPDHHGAPLPDGSADPDVVPALILAMSVEKPSCRPGEAAVEALRHVDPRYARNFLAGDRLFNSQSEDIFQLPIRAMGYQPVYDYSKDQLGAHGDIGGAQLVEGNWYCPSMPAELITATHDLVVTETIDQQTWINRIRARTAYLLMPKQATDAEGHRRMMCPAEAKRTQCPLKPHTLGRGIHLPLVDPVPRPEGPPKVCEKHSLTVPPEAGAKLWQPLQYGTAEWQRVYFRLRNSTEGMNGFAKDPLRERIEPGGTRRIRGIAAQTILLAFQLAHANKRKLQSWADAVALNGDRPRRRPTRRRQTKALGTWTPTGYIATA
ncbi:hypothetical protein [Streptomyces sp. ISL-94]|uniref:hypothetical protein n=1 Tax=Streptomyces sp. ISL-94 TaxID=2819190 RepID=UPI001BE66F09|nr:hypothetical protein [Streptomyces sp. ISL-94]MBT2478755.1 hypothetical protein [Streptomyces sp. ISL-94]